MPRAWLRTLGALLACAGCIWVVWQFIHSGAWGRLVEAGQWAVLGWRMLVGVPIYLVGLCSIAAAWCLLQSALSERPAFYRQLFAIYATTQFAKYAPGNVAHYLGRHLWLRKQGFEHTKLLLGTLGEAVLLVAAATAWASPAWSGWQEHLAWTPPLWLSLSLGWLLVVVGLAGVQGVSRLHRRLAWMSRLRPERVAALFPLYVAFFGCATLALAVPACAMNAGEVSLPLLAMATAASWVAGFLVIGAPAGVGVREAVFVLLLRGHAPPEGAVLLAAAFRVISFCGDFSLLLIGLVMTRLEKRHELTVSSPKHGGEAVGQDREG